MEILNSKDGIFSQYDRDKIMARDIISKWGEKENLYSVDIPVNGGMYNEYIYHEKGLELVFSELEGLFILYNGEKVLGYSNESLGTIVYKAGEWEKQLKEIYDVVNRVRLQKRENSNYDRGIDVLHMLDLVGNCTINNNLIIVRDGIRFENDNNRISITYNVFYEDELVFCGSYLPSNREKVYSFEPGEWEEEIKMYIKGLSLKREIFKNGKKLKTLTRKHEKNTK